MGESLRLLRRERDLWVFPVLGATLMAAWLAAVLVVMRRPVTGWLLAHGFSHTAAAYANIGLVLLASYPLSVVASLLNTALASCLYERMEGRPGTKAAGWARAYRQRGPIMRFNLIALLVSGLFQLVGQLLSRLRMVPWLGPLVANFGLMAWAAASFFVIPILAIEQERSAVAAIRGSTQMARQNWGKALGGMVTIGLVVMVPLVVAVMVAIIVLANLGIRHHDMRMYDLAMPFLIVAIVFVSTLISAPAQVAYQTGLYRFAKTGKVEPFSTTTLVDAWAPYRQG
jgi:hypothetical protein